MTFRCLVKVSQSKWTKLSIIWLFIALGSWPTHNPHRFLQFKKKTICSRANQEDNQMQQSQPRRQPHAADRSIKFYREKRKQNTNSKLWLTLSENKYKEHFIVCTPSKINHLCYLLRNLSLSSSYPLILSYSKKQEPKEDALFNSL